MDALASHPINFNSICKWLGYEVKPLQMHPIQLAMYDSPSELFRVMSLKDGTTCFEDSDLVQAFIEASQASTQAYQLVWLKELGRVHASSVQGALVELITNTEIVLPNRRIDVSGTSILIDSNYAALDDAVFTLVTQDAALKRRFPVNIHLDYLPPEQELFVLEQLCQAAELVNLDSEFLSQVVKVGASVREQQAEGSLQSLAPPTIAAYMACLRLKSRLSHLSPQEAVLRTVLGNHTSDDTDVVQTVLNEVFGLQSEDECDLAQTASMF